MVDGKMDGYELRTRVDSAKMCLSDIKFEMINLLDGTLDGESKFDYVCECGKQVERVRNFIDVVREAYEARLNEIATKDYRISALEERIKELENGERRYE